MSEEDAPYFTGWSRPVDLREALKGKPLPGPTICDWPDGDAVRALFYPNEIHSVFGEPESMKSWLLLHAAHQQISRGSHVMYIDMEANDRSIVSRLRALGAARTAIRQRFHYFRPDEPLTEDDQDRIGRRVRKWQPTLAVLDGVTEAFSLLGLSINAPEDAAQWFRAVARRFQVKPTALYAGPAIVELDHVVKSREGRGGWAIGSQHKKAGIKGAAYSVEPVRRFGNGLHGVSHIFLEKDSAGAVGWTSHGKDRRRLVAELHCESDADSGSVIANLESPVSAGEPASELEVPLAQSHDFRLLMQRAWDYINAHPSVSLRTIRRNVVGGNGPVGDAVAQLTEEGYICNEGKPSASKYVVVKKFQALRVVPHAK